MFELIKKVIKSKDYKLEDILNKINTLWIKGDITEEQKEELVTSSRENALAENSYRPLEERVNQLYKLVEDLTTKVKALENKDTAEDSTESAKEYPQYIKPTGSHDTYNKGDKMTYIDDKKYISLIDNNVWTPEEYPQGWKEIIEENVEENV